MVDFPSGIAYPFRFAPGGGVARVEGTEKLRTNLKALVKTAVQERTMRKDVGTIGYQEVFRNSDVRDVGWITGLVRTAIRKQEPRVLVHYVRLKKVDKVLYIQVAGAIKPYGEPVEVEVSL